MKVPSLAPQTQTAPADRQVSAGARSRNRDDVDPTIRKAAEGLEAMFVNTMMQAMRNTVEESEFSLENPATKIYRGMLDSEVSNQAARTNSIGLADQIIAYLEQRGYTGNKAPVHGRPKPGAESKPLAVEPKVDKKVHGGTGDES